MTSDQSDREFALVLYFAFGPTLFVLFGFFLGRLAAA